MSTQISHIHLIEDDPYLADLFTTKLKKNKFSVTVSRDGLEALTTIPEIKPNLILLDLLLPHINGYDVLKTLKSNPDTSAIPVFIISNLDHKEAQEKGLTIGADKYFVKVNTELSDLVNAIKEFLHSHA